MDDKFKKAIRREEIYARAYCGLYQVIHNPWKFSVLILIVGVYAFGWKICKENYLEKVNLPEMVVVILEYAVAVLFVLLFLLSVAIFLSKLAQKQGYKDEVDLIAAFSSVDLKVGYPILLSKKRIKRENVTVTVSEFYSRIPKERWEAMKKNIEDEMSVRLVNPYIEYGGKNHDKGKRIVIYTLPNRKGKDWGTMYEE